CVAFPPVCRKLLTSSLCGFAPRFGLDRGLALAYYYLTWRASLCSRVPAGTFRARKQFRRMEAKLTKLLRFSLCRTAASAALILACSWASAQMSAEKVAATNAILQQVRASIAKLPPN